jgi:ADP-ribosyl-[dinitrogen reductase] hydrolase
MRRTRDHFRGCLLAGAVGDALGAPVEFLGLQEIRAHYGPAGIADLDVAYGRVGAITDDTQMTLFTAEGLLRAGTRQNHRGIPADFVAVVHHAYIRWLHTQGERSDHPWSDEEMDGWLYGIPALHARRAPGNTCLAGLRSGEERGFGRPINDSKGCGTVMRTAPVGLARVADPFRLGCEIAAITHGHPTGILTAGFLSQLLARIIAGASLRQAIQDSLPRLAAEADSQETVGAIGSASEAASSTRPSAETVERLGGGWVAEEALAIALYCSLVHEDDFEAALRLAVNHGGDSDSTGAITGNILGALLGIGSIPGRWLAELELRREIEAVADDMLVWFDDGDEWWERYPGW